MKKLLVFLSAMFVCVVALAQTINVSWKIGNTTYATNTCEYGDTLTAPTPPTKYGYTFQGWAQYILLEYIESTGTQYIDTGVTPSANFDFYLDAMITSNELYQNVFGTTTNSIFSRVVADTLLSSSINGNASNGGIGFGGADNRFYIGLSPRRILSANGTEKTLKRPYSPSGTFMLLNSGTKARVYGAKLYDGTNLVFNLIPAKHLADNAIGMYDTVTKTFFENAGTGTFIAGPEVGDL